MDIFFNFISIGCKSTKYFSYVQILCAFFLFFPNFISFCTQNAYKKIFFFLVYIIFLLYLCGRLRIKGTKFTFFLL